MNEPIIVTVTRDYDSTTDSHIYLDTAVPYKIRLFENNATAILIHGSTKEPDTIEYKCFTYCPFSVPAGTKLEWRVESKEIKSDLRSYNESLSEFDFNKYLSERLTEITETLQIKAKEYVRNSDRFHNFNTGSKLKQKPRELILDDYMFKHYVSYRDMLSDIDKGNYPTKKYIKEKLGDLIVYFILQEIGLKQKLNGNNNTTD